MRRSEQGRIMQAFRLFLLASVFLAMAAYVIFLLSDKNYRRYRLAQRDNMLFVERGRFLPLGFEAYVPDEMSLKQAYAPIVIPPGEVVETRTAFEDRAEVDRALYQRLSPWAKTRLLPNVSDPNQLALGVAYVRRCEILPSISEDMRQELRATRADAALRQAEGFVRGSTQALIKARTFVEQAMELGCTQPGRAHTALGEIERRMTLLDAAHAPQNGAVGAFDETGPALDVAPLPPPYPPSLPKSVPQQLPPEDVAPIRPQRSLSTPPAVTPPPVAR